MASLRSQAFRSLTRSQTPFIRSQQRRWAQVHDVRFLATHRDPNQVLEKYREKLKEKAQQEGHQSIDSLKEAYSEKITKLRREASTVLTPEPPSPSAAPHTPPPPPKPQSPVAAAAKSAGTGIKPLSSYLDVEKIRALPPKEIEALWRLRHANNPHSICAVVPLETYDRIASAARQNPQFILPLPRSAAAEGSTDAAQSADGAEGTNTGADIHFLQWGFHPPASKPSAQNSHTSTVIFTPLAAYKLHGAYAQPHTTITHHLDLAEDKGLVLMHGQVMPESGVSTAEATWLVSCVQRFYDFGGQASGRKGELLRMFTRGDVGNFKIEELMAEAEKL
ncbi:ATP11 protein-domain-containing protein [Aspergillus egyptiacus]|nr:ATP11 protein-domain-containing protein [Aspergillus egyptiacus]